MSSRLDTEALVVGAGPVGLTAALGLAQAGIKVSIIDKHWRTGTHSYALALHARTLNLLEDLGVLDEVAAHGHRVDRVALWEGGEHKVAMNWPDLGRRHPYVLVVPQSILEDALARALEQAGVKVLWNHRLEDMDASGPAATIARLEQVASGYPVSRLEWTVAGTLAAHPRFIIGADGYRSLVRDKLNIVLEAAGDPSTYAVYEFQGAAPDTNEVRVVLDRQGSCVLWPMAGDRCRWSFQIEDGGTFDPGLEALNHLIAARAPWYGEVSGPVHWSSAVMFAPRLAASFGSGHTWLAGDAAHMASPVGVHSMNLGVLEAAELASRVAGIVKGQGADTELRDYDLQRRQIWRGLLGLDTSLAPEPAAAEWVRTHAQGILPTIPATGADLQQLLAQIGLRFNLA